MNRSLALLLVLAGSTLTSVAQDKQAASLLPETTVVYAEIAHPADLMAAIFDHPLREKIESLPPWQAAVKSDGYRRFLTGRKFFEIQMGMEWREALETLTAGGIHVGVDSATNGAVLLVRAKSPESLELPPSSLQPDIEARGRVSRQARATMVRVVLIVMSSSYGVQPSSS